MGYLVLFLVERVTLRKGILGEFEQREMGRNAGRPLVKEISFPEAMSR